MPPTAIHSAPSLDSFTTLADHQSQTPATFYNSKPVLHFHAVGARALISRDQVKLLQIFADGIEEEGGSVTITAVVDVYVSSDTLTIFNTAISNGISIPYPAISLHAIQSLEDPADASTRTQGLYMQLELTDPESMTMDDEDDSGVLELTLIPAPSPAEASPAPIQALFEAVSSCSNLHPDAAEDDEEEMGGGTDSRIVFEGNVGYEGMSGLPGVQLGSTDGGLPPPFPGSGGWITAENVSEFFDEEGNWIGGENGENGESLGEGAGRLRGRDEVDEPQVNGHGENGVDESKRVRTE